jgi:hypothetical protein
METTKQQQITELQKRKAYRIERARKCAQYMIANHLVCAGCPNDRDCGIYERDNKFLARLIKECL